MGNHFCSFSFRLTAPLNLCPIYPKFLWALAKLSEHLHKKFKVNQRKIKGDCQWERKAAEMISYSKMPLVSLKQTWNFPVSGFNHHGFIVTTLNRGHDQSHRDHEMAVREEHHDNDAFVLQLRAALTTMIPALASHYLMCVQASESVNLWCF